MRNSCTSGHLSPMRWQHLLLSLAAFLACLEPSNGDYADGVSLMSVKEFVNNPDILNSWTYNKDPCIPPQWLGVVCNPSGRVRELSLNKMGLQGRLSPLVGGLVDLEKLSLQGNKMTGHIPDELAMTKLKSLDLGNNLFYGPLENTFKKLPNLEFFYAQNNYFAGLLPETLNLAQKLIVLNLGGNNFHGRVPDNIAELHNLVFLLLGANLLGGPIPDALSNMPSLRFLNLANNSFTGEIPTGFSDCPNLLNMDVSNNQLTGQIPASLLAKPGFRYGGNTGLIVPPGAVVAAQADPGPLPTQDIPLLTEAPSTTADPTAGTTVQASKATDSSSGGGMGAGGVIGIIIGVLAALALVTAVAVLFVRHMQANNPYFPGLGRWQPRWRKTYQRMNSPKLQQTTSGRKPGGVLRAFTFDELAQATHDFSPECQQSIGAARSVFLGTLNTGEFVAVERLPGAVAHLQPEKEFISAVESIGRLNHPHLVKLLGYCCQKQNRCLVMEHPTSGSLRDHLSGSLGDRAPLSWHQRLEAAVGLGSALHYLHNEGQVHGNVTPPAVFMDSFLKAKISALSVRATKGNAGSAVQDAEKALLRSSSDMLMSAANDVHKFGFLLLELFSGTADNDRLAARWAALDTLDINQVEAHMDARVTPSDICSKEALLKLLRAALSCVKPSKADRPEISVVLDELRQALALINKAREGLTPPGTPPGGTGGATTPADKDLMRWSPPREGGVAERLVSGQSETTQLEIVIPGGDLLSQGSFGGSSLGVMTPNGGEEVVSGFSGGPLWSANGLGLGDLEGGRQNGQEAKEAKPAWMLE